MWVLFVKLMSPAPWFLEPKPGEEPRSVTLAARRARSAAIRGSIQSTAGSVRSEDR